LLLHAAAAAAAGLGCEQAHWARHAVSPPKSLLTPFSAPHAAAAAGGFPVVLDNLWLGREEGEAVAAALVPKLQKTKVAVEQLLFEVATLEVGWWED
jgi:hypothetical protein